MHQGRQHMERTRGQELRGDPVLTDRPERLLPAQQIHHIHHVHQQLPRRRRQREGVVVEARVLRVDAQRRMLLQTHSEVHLARRPSLAQLARRLRRQLLPALVDFLAQSGRGLQHLCGPRSDVQHIARRRLRTTSTTNNNNYLQLTTY